MEVDELEGGFLQQFSSMQTIDREELIKQVLRLVGSNITYSAAKFYLEMNQWNVQAAVCSYFDLETGESVLPGMLLVRDVTVGEGESVPPASRFTKTWRVQNPGPGHWPQGCVLRHSGGTLMADQDTVPVDPLDAYLSTDISVEMTSPQADGIYESKWRMSTPTGNFFGDTIWVIISVEVAGTMAITQQFHSLNPLGHAHAHHGHPLPPSGTAPHHHPNPFRGFGGGAGSGAGGTGQEDMS